MKLASTSRLSVSMRIRMQQLCQPDATRPPSSVALAACSSRCIGCGSYSAAKATISARVTTREPQSVTWPGVKSSQCKRGTAIPADDTHCSLDATSDEVNRCPETAAGMRAAPGARD
jgi:hypothetical protein